MSEYADDERETMAMINNATIRRLLQYRRIWGLSAGQNRALQKRLAKRRQYQRTAKIRVWELDCGPNGKLLFDDKDEMLLWDDGEAEYRMIWMPGREYGELPIADWL